MPPEAGTSAQAGERACEWCKCKLLTYFFTSEKFEIEKEKNFRTIGTKFVRSPRPKRLREVGSSESPSRDCYRWIFVRGCNFGGEAHGEQQPRGRAPYFSAASPRHQGSYHRGSRGLGLSDEYSQWGHHRRWIPSCNEILGEG